MIKFKLKNISRLLKVRRESSSGKPFKGRGDLRFIPPNYRH